MQEKKDILANIDILTKDVSSQPSRLKKYWILMTVFFVFFFLAYIYWGSNILSADVKVAKSIKIDSSNTNSFKSNFEAIGYVVAKKRAIISPEVIGTIVELNVEVGDEIEKYFVIARIDATLAKQKLLLAKSNVALSEAILMEAKILVNEAKQKLSRTSKMIRNGFISDQAHDDALINYDTSVARLNSAVIQNEVNNKAYNLALAEFDRYTVRAPFAGVVIRKNAHVGEYVSATSSNLQIRSNICELVDMNSLEIEIDVNESNISKVFLNQKVEVSFSAYPNLLLESKIIEIAPTANRNQATIEVKVEIKEANKYIVPQLGARVKFYENDSTEENASIDNKSLSPSIYIPSTAVKVEGGKKYVWALDNNVLRKQFLSVDNSQGKKVRVLSGLDSNTFVVIEHKSTLREGQTVNIIE